MPVPFRRLIHTLITCSVFVSPQLLAAESTPLWFPNTDIKLPKVTTVSALSNGLRYVILPTSRSTKEVSIRVRIAAGVAQETNLTPTARIAALDTVMGTNWTVASDYQQTVFSLDLQDASQDDIEQALSSLVQGLERPVGDIEQAKLAQAAETSLVDIEQIMTQKHLESVSYVRPVASLDAQSLEQEAHNETQQFKTRYFTPNNVSVVIAGGITPRKVEKAVQSQFGLWHVANAQQDRLPNLDFNVDKTHVEQALVSVSALTHLDENTDSKLLRKEILKATLANKMLEHRIQSAFEQQHIEGVVSVENQVLFNQNLLSQVRVTEFNETQQELANQIIEREIKRTAASGFKQAEYEMVVSQVRNQLTKETRLHNKENYTRSQADRMVKAIHEGTVYTDPSYDLDLLNFHVAHLNEFDISKEFEQVWGAEGSVTL